MYHISDLETFVTVAQCNGITAAANRIGISAATTSHRIAKLEKALGVVLFYRNSRTFQITDEGRIFWEKIEDILTDLRQAERDAGSGLRQIRGHLRVTMSPWILSRFIMPRLSKFRLQNPELTVELLATDRFVSLADEGQDCAIRVGQLPDSSLLAKKLCDNDRILCAAPSFLKTHGTPETIEDLNDAQWVCLPWQRRFNVLNENGRKITLSISRNFDVSNSDMLTEGAVHGLGLAVKSRLAIQNELTCGKLVEIMHGRLLSAEAPIWFVFAPEARSGYKIKAFRELAIKAFK